MSFAAFVSFSGEADQDAGIVRSMEVPQGHDVRTCVCPDCVAVRRAKNPRSARPPRTLREGSLLHRLDEWFGRQPEGFQQTLAGLIAVLVLILVVGAIWLAGSILRGNSNVCTQHRHEVAEQVTILQMADGSLSFSEALLLAERIEGPPPPGC